MTRITIPKKKNCLIKRQVNIQIEEKNLYWWLHHSKQLLSLNLFLTVLEMKAKGYVFYLV